MLGNERYQGHGPVPALRSTNIPGHDPLTVDQVLALLQVLNRDADLVVRTTCLKVSVNGHARRIAKVREFL